MILKKGGFSVSDAQCRQAAAYCSLCGRTLYDGDEFYAVNGLSVCEDCLPGFARETFRSFRLSGRDWRGFL